MKLIEPRTRALEREIATLNARVAELEAESQRWKEAYQQVWKSSSSRARKDSLAVLTKHSDHHSTPSYLKPTAASEKRAVPSTAAADSTLSRLPSRATEHHHGSLLYDDGKLVNAPEEDEHAEVPNYLRHTEASARQAGLSYSASGSRGWGVSAPLITTTAQRTLLPEEETDDVRQPGPWDAGYQSDAEEDPSPEEEEDLEPALTCTRCDAIEAAATSPTNQALSIRSRLHDQDFYTTPASECYVPMRLQTRTLKTALRLAQETAWCALRTHWPLIQRSKYLEGPEEFKFGREELDRVFGNEQYPTEANEMCGAPRGSVMNALLGVVFLRNAVCHPMQRDTRSVDQLLQTAQYLAVTLLDEPRAFRMRRMRDALQTAAREAHAEIEALEPLACLPHARPWAIHHQRLFSAVRFAVDHRMPDRGRFSPIIVRAAMTWSLSFVRPGELDPIYLENVERAKKCMREAGHGRRASALAEIRYGEGTPPAADQPAAQSIDQGSENSVVHGWPTTVAEPQPSATGW
ncbi:hypothetical protein LTR85_011743 [Meristemomyces frigidus]|nr:hypothetical protein LTR85_011743 [Meristemomyces frigidus]